MSAGRNNSGAIAVIFTVIHAVAIIRECCYCLRLFLA